MTRALCYSLGQWGNDGKEMSPDMMSKDDTSCKFSAAANS